MDLIENINSSKFIKLLNNFLEFNQEKFEFLSKNSLFVKNIDIFINIFAFATLIFSTFLDSEKLGITVLISGLLLALKYLIKSNAKITLDRFDFLVILYVMFFCLATTFSSWLIDSLHGLMKVFIYFMSYLVFKDILKTNPSLRIAYLGLIAVLSSVESFIGIYQYIFKIESLATWQDLSDMNPEQLMTRVFGTLQPLNPNLMAGYLISTMPAILGCVFYDFRKKQLNLAAIIGLMATLVAIVFTGCRGSYMAMMAQILVFIAISGHMIWHDFNDKQYLKKIWIGAILAGIVGIAALISLHEAIRTRVLSIFAQREDSSNSFRFNVYQSSFRMFKDNFLAGIGVGNWTFREVYGLYMRTGFDALGSYCVPLEIAVETGIFGLLNFIVFIATTIIVAAKKILSNASYNEKIITSVVVISITGMMVHGIVDTVWFRPQIQFIFWLIIAILGVTCEEQK